MELNITEIEHKNLFDKIPENSFPVKVVKRNINNVKFKEQEQNQQNQQIKQLPKQYAKMVRPSVPALKPTISYDDIISKMGMVVHDGKLHLLGSQSTQNIPTQNTLTQNTATQNIPQNNYIYNKYFKDKITEPNVSMNNAPMNVSEYKNMLINTIIQKHKIKQIKSTKLIMPTSNIHVAGGTANLNKLFDFSKRR